MKTLLSQWSWHRDNAAGDGELVAEASGLGLAPGDRPNVVKIYSPTTGVTRLFKLAGPEVNRYNEVIAWSYWDTEASTIQVRILND